MAKGKAGKRKAKASASRVKPSSKPHTKSPGTFAPKGGAPPPNQEKLKSQPNAYDVFQNKRRKNPVLGARVRGERRDLVKSKASAVSQRAQGLLKESLLDRKTSKFRDARLGGDAVGDSADAGDRSSVRRLVKLRQREAKRSFGIGREDELTIGGKALSGMQDSELRSADPDGEGNDPADEFDPDDPIGRSKEQKALAAQEKKEHEEQLKDFDADFSSLIGELDFRPPKAQQLKLEKKSAPDEYDCLMRELSMQKRAVATDRLKTPEEIAREKAEELEALERERSARAQPKLDEAVEAEGEEGTTTAVPVPAESEDDDSGTDGEDEESEEEAKEADEVEEDDEPENQVDAGTAELDDDDKLGESCIRLLSAQEAASVDAMVNAKGEEDLPYSLECPVRKRAIADLLKGARPETAVKLVHRVRTCTAVPLAAGNREKLCAFFIALLDFASEVAVRSEDGDLSAKGLQILYAIRPQLVQLAREHPDEAQNYFVERLRVLGPRTLPKIADICCLKLIAILFPVTDFKHPITSPAALLADHWATRMASLGSDIEELISEALFLWGVLYDLLLGDRFSTAFFQLGVAILDSCWKSARKGREGITEVSADVVALLTKSVQQISASEPAAARVVASELLRPLLHRDRRVDDVDIAKEQAKSLGSVLDDVCKVGLQPLVMFEAPPPQIRSLEPIFHEEGDISNRGRGMELTETQLLKRKLNDERRAASRQLKRDAAAMQSLTQHKDSVRRAARFAERKRVSKIMETEKAEIKQMMTEGGGMDTSLQSYSKNKAQKKENKRMGGNATAETAQKAAKPNAGADKVRKTPKRKKGR